MRISFVLPNASMSGGIRVVAIYARLLMARGHEVVLTSPPERGVSWRKRLRQLFSRKSHLEGSGLDHRVLEKWRPVVDSDLPDADVVIATWWETAEWVAALSSKKGAKVYFVQHHEVFSWLPTERAHASYRLPMHKIVIAQWLARVMQSEYGDTEVDLVPNSVDHSQFFAPARGKQAQPTVGFLYARAPFKGVDVTLRAIELLRASFPNLQVVAFGAERPAADIVERLSSYTFDPRQSSLRNIYASCDVWMTASRSEGFNLPAMEAMACRTPVVSTRTGWPEEAIVNQVNGFCVDIDDAEALADGAKWLLELDDAAWRRVSEAAYATVRDSSWEHSTDLFERALERARQRFVPRTEAQELPGLIEAMR